MDLAILIRRPAQRGFQWTPEARNGLASDSVLVPEPECLTSDAKALHLSLIVKESQSKVTSP